MGYLVQNGKMAKHKASISYQPPESRFKINFGTQTKIYFKYVYTLPGSLWNGLSTQNKKRTPFYRIIWAAAIAEVSR